MANGGGNQMEIMDFVALKLLSVLDATPIFKACAPSWINVLRRKHA